MNMSIAGFLKDFGEPTSNSLPNSNAMKPNFPAFEELASLTNALNSEHSFGEGFSTEIEETFDIKAERDAAFKQGSLEATVRLEAMQNKALEQLQLRHEQELEQVKSHYEEAFVAKLSSEFHSLNTTLIQSTGDQVAAVLEPVVKEVFAAKAISELKTIIEDALIGNSSIKIQVSGRLVMFEKLKSQLPNRVDTITFIESDNPDLTVIFEGGFHVTRLSEWQKTFDEVAL